MNLFNTLKDRITKKDDDNPLVAPSAPREAPCPPWLRTWRGRRKHMAVSANHKFLFLGGFIDSSFRCYLIEGDSKQCDPILCTQYHTAPVTALRVAADQNALLSADARGEVAIWNAALNKHHWKRSPITLEPVARFCVHDGEVIDGDVNLNVGLAASVGHCRATHSNQVLVYSVHLGICIRTLRLPTSLPSTLPGPRQRQRAMSLPSTPEQDTREAFQSTSKFKLHERAARLSAAQVRFVARKDTCTQIAVYAVEQGGEGQGHVFLYSLGGEIVARAAVGGLANAFGVSPHGNYVYVGLKSGDVRFFHTADLLPAAKINVLKIAPPTLDIHRTPDQKKSDPRAPKTPGLSVPPPTPKDRGFKVTAAPFKIAEDSDDMSSEPNTPLGDPVPTPTPKFKPTPPTTEPKWTPKPRPTPSEGGPAVKRHHSFNGEDTQGNPQDNAPKPRPPRQRRLSQAAPASAPPSSIVSLAVSPDEQFCIAALDNGSLLLCLLPESSIVRGFAAYVTGMQQVASALGKYLWTRDSGQDSARRRRSQPSEQRIRQGSQSSAGSTQQEREEGQAGAGAAPAHARRSTLQALKGFFNFRK